MIAGAGWGRALAPACLVQPWHDQPDLFTRRAQVGPPPPEVLWEARRRLADHGMALAFDVQIERADGAIVLAVYGAGVVGRLPDLAWRAVAELLTTCCSQFCEPRPDADGFGGRLVRPARPLGTAAARSFGSMGVLPETVSVGDVLHTWWRYPFHGTLRAGCGCPAHDHGGRAEFGPVVAPAR